MNISIKKLLKDWVIPPGYIFLFNKYTAGVIKNKSPDTDIRLFKDQSDIKHKHIGERVFILGAGSSIKRQDLKQLEGEHVISVSNTFVHPDYVLFRPKYHVLPPIINSHGHLYPEENWIPWLYQMAEKTFEAEMFCHIGDKPYFESNKIFQNRVVHWNEYVKWDEQPITELDLARVPSIWSVSEYAITVALYLGYDEIYLIGFDHDWFNGTLVYFYDEKKEHIMQPDSSRLSFADAEFQMRRHAYIFKKYKFLYALEKNIFNANADPEHYMDVFPKVDYDSLF